MALCRTPLDSYENLVKNLCSKTAWRDAALRHPNIDFKELSKLSTEQIRNVIENRISKMQYKGEEFLINKPAEIDEIIEMKRELALFFFQKRVLILRKSQKSA